MGFFKGLTLDTQLWAQMAQHPTKAHKHTHLRVWLPFQKKYKKYNKKNPQPITSQGLFPLLWHTPGLLSQLEADLWRDVREQAG